MSDISSEMIKETKKRINELGLNQGKIKYEVCDLEKLKGLFDVVVCLDVFIHYPQPVAEEMVQHLCDLSKEKLIVSFAPYTPVLAVLKNIGKLFPGPSKTTRAYTLKEAARFADIDVSKMAKQITEIKSMLTDQNQTNPENKINLPSFTPREASVLQLVGEGLMNKEIARKLETSIRNCLLYTSPSPRD